MAKKRSWRAMPLQNEIINILVKNRGEILTTDLLRQLKLNNKDITRTELQDMLFRLEVKSFIYLIEIKKGESKIEISPYARFSNGVRKRVQEFMTLRS